MRFQKQKSIFWGIGIFYMQFSAVNVGAQQNFFDITGNDSITILFAGDVMGHKPQLHAAYDTSRNDFDFMPCFQFIQPILNKMDITICNFETTLAGLPYTGYPTFSSPDALARDTHFAGFKYFAMANNHCYDKGRSGFERTIRVLDSLNINHFGCYRNAEERNSNYPLILEIKGVKIALFNYTYATNGISVEYPNVVNYINKSLIINDFRKADSLKADLKIVFLHWGMEYELSPNTYQRELARFLVNCGADAIIGSHPHVVQTFEILEDSSNHKGVPVFYSLGNFISNQRDRYRDGGAMCILSIKANQNFDRRNILLNNQNNFIVKASYIPYWVYKGSLNGKYQYYVLPLPDYLDTRLSEEDKTKMVDFYSIIRDKLNNMIIYSLSSHFSVGCK
jgi:poly-gamma-glutamate synthesis protein (capsule biosynthesis protein)